MTSKTAEKYGKQIVRHNRELRWVKLGLMKVSPCVQRDLKQGRVDYLASVMDPDKLGNPEVSHRAGYFYIMDGQHRVEALKKWLGPGWEEQHVQCWVAEGLTEQDEAEIFLSLNDKLSVDVFQKFKVAVRAGRQIESEIEGIVKVERLTISKQDTKGAIRAVGTLVKAFKRGGAEPLRRTLAIIRDAFGDAGFEGMVIDGLNLLCIRYNGVLDERAAVESLRRVNGGVKGLLNMAEQLREKSGNLKPHCLAAATIMVLNRDRAPKDKLPSWWKE